MNILITGCRGQLGNEMQLLEVSHPEHAYWNTDREELDITDQAAVMQFVADHDIDGIVNCAAYTADRDPRPIYEQIQSELRRLMLTGALPPGSRLPSVRELAGQLAINPNTIQRAYRELESAGYILSVAGKGSFVAQTDALTLHERQQATEAFAAAAARLRALGLDDDALIQLLQREERAE